MATEQVVQWMKQDLKLSQVVRNFETDFANGYLFGEILVQYGIYDEISEFSKKTNKEAKVNNFYRIEDALRDLKVRFDAKMIHNIMQEERGAALRLLYQLKLALQKRMGPGALELEEISQSNLKQSTVQKVLQKRMEKTQNLAGTITAPTVGGKDIRSKKQKMQDNHLLKFNVAQKLLFQDAQANDDKEYELIASLQQAKRSENREKLRENQEFMKEWEEEGRANWQKNQQTRQKNIERVQYFEDREVGLYKSKLSRELVGATNEMHNGFSDFDKNLQKLGIEQNVNMEDAVKKMEEKKGIPPGQIQNFSFPATMNKIKETKKQSDFAGKERERRRRKMAVDQEETQQRLDKQKQEDMLIEKLLNQQESEQKQAYASERIQKCKALQKDQRKRKALDIAVEREIQMKQIEAQRIADAKDKEESRQSAIQAKREEYNSLRKDQKQSKRRVSIEIASGVVDLIMDLGEEVFATTLSRKNKKLTKAEWREFSDIFISGKKVSLRNVVKKVAASSDDKDSLYAGSPQKDEIHSAIELITQNSNEPSLHDFFQFLCSSGIFNLAQLDSALLERIISEMGLKNANKDGYLTLNQQAGLIIENLNQKPQLVLNQSGLQLSSQNYASAIKEETMENESIQQDQPSKEMGSSTKAKSQMQSQSKLKSNNESEAQLGSISQIKPVGPIPSNLPLKLVIMGRGFAGKKTVAKHIQAKHGGDKNVTIFNMDEIIATALQYIAPKKTDEAADPKEKKKKGGKGAEDAAPSDIFEGKDSSRFKEIANEIKKEFFQSFEGEVPQKVDLVSCVLDDELLIDLFVERLRLEYTGVDFEPTLTDLEADIAREREIETILEENVDSAAGIGSVPDLKAKAKAPAKGGKGGATSEETLKEELDQIRAAKIKGWILLDFPRSLNQIKLLENRLTGFEAQSHQPKQAQQEAYESWCNVFSPSTLLTGKDVSVRDAPQSSGLDGVLILGTPEEECLRRSQNRKIDPTTNTVYHMEDSPPEDQKTLDRLQDFSDEAGEEARLKKLSAAFDQSVRAIQGWTKMFGLTRENQSECAVQLDIMIGRADQTDFWKNKTDVVSQVDSRLENLIQFRQAEFSKMREQVKNDILERERKQAELEQRESALKEDGQVAATNQPADSTKNKDETAKTNNNDQVAISAEGISEMQIKAGQQNLESVDGIMKSYNSKRHLSDHQGSVGTTSKSYGRSQKAQMQRIVVINDNQKRNVLENMLLQYYADGMQQFNKLRHERQIVFRELNQTQQSFLTYLEREGDMQRKINEFCESYNRFSNEFPELIGNVETKSELQNRVEILSQQLWGVIMARKDEALKERQSYMEGGWVHVQMCNLLTCTTMLIQNEFNRFKTLASLVTSHQINEETDFGDLVKRYIERGKDPYNSSKKTNDQAAAAGTSPILSELMINVNAKIQQYFGEYFVVSLSNDKKETLHKERQNFETRVAVLVAQSILVLQEVDTYANQVFEKLDDWIVVAVKLENQAAQTSTKQLAMSVDDAVMSMNTIFIEKESVKSHIETLDFVEGSFLYMKKAVIPVSLPQTRFDISCLHVFFRQFRDNRVEINLLDAQTFCSFMVLNLQSGLMPKSWRYVSFDRIAEMVNRFKASPLNDKPASAGNAGRTLFRRKSLDPQKDDGKMGRIFVDWRRILTAFALGASPLPTQADKEALFSEIRDSRSENSSTVSLKAFKKVPAWFDKAESTLVRNAAGELLTDAEMAKMQEIDSDASDSEEEKIDLDRLRDLKALLFETYRVPNRDEIEAEEVIGELDIVFKDVRTEVTQTTSLFQILIGQTTN